MTDLTKFLREASRRSDGWSDATFFRYLAFLLANHSNATLDWDIGAGEEWARVISNDMPIAYLRVDLPLILVASARVKPAVLEELEKLAVVVEYEEADKPAFSLDVVAFNEVFPSHTWRTDVCSPESFSANDLHWMTAT